MADFNQQQQAYLLAQQQQAFALQQQAAQQAAQQGNNYVQPFPQQGNNYVQPFPQQGNNYVQPDTQPFAAPAGMTYGGVYVPGTTDLTGGNLIQGGALVKPRARNVSKKPLSSARILSRYQKGIFLNVNPSKKSTRTKSAKDPKTHSMTATKATKIFKLDPKKESESPMYFFLPAMICGGLPNIRNYLNSNSIVPPQSFVEGNGASISLDNYIRVTSVSSSDINRYLLRSGTLDSLSKFFIYKLETFIFICRNCKSNSLNLITISNEKKDELRSTNPFVLIRANEEPSKLEIRVSSDFKKEIAKNINERIQQIINGNLGVSDLVLDISKFHQLGKGSTGGGAGVSVVSITQKNINYTLAGTGDVKYRTPYIAVVLKMLMKGDDGSFSREIFLPLIVKEGSTLNQFMDFLSEDNTYNISVETKSSVRSQFNITKRAMPSRIKTKTEAADENIDMADIAVGLPERTAVVDLGFGNAEPDVVPAERGTVAFAAPVNTVLPTSPFGGV